MLPLALLAASLLAVSAHVVAYESRIAPSLTQQLQRAARDAGVFTISPSTELMRPHQVPGRQAYGGLVYVKHEKADRYHVSLPLSGYSFEFDFTVP